MLHSLVFEAGARFFSLPEDFISKLNSSRQNHQAKSSVPLVVAQSVSIADQGDSAKGRYVPVRKSGNGPWKRPTQEELAITMARVPSKYKKRQFKEGEEVWSPREVVARVLALNHWEDIDGLLNRWLGRFNRKNFPPLISVFSLVPTNLSGSSFFRLLQSICASSQCVVYSLLQEFLLKLAHWNMRFHIDCKPCNHSF